MVFLILLSVSACNQLDTVLPSLGTYHVNALVNHSSLDECSVITAGDTILPYFSNSVAGDPDLVNLVVYLEDSGGKPAGNRVRYTTGPVPAVEDTLEGGDVSEPETSLETGQLSETAKNLSESGKAGSDDETAADYAGIVKDPSFAGGLLIPVDNFSGQLPPFPLARNLEIGYYTMVFEIRGSHDLLSRVGRQVFYTGNQEFTTGGIQYYLPGVYGNKHLVPQGLNVMLETQVDYGEDLKPYAIWYNGSRLIGEGFVTGGVAQVIWKASQQTGFHTIRVEVFPFEPHVGVKGIAKELSLPVSSQTEENRPLSAQDGALLYRYQLAGDLRETGTGAELNRKNTGKNTPPEKNVPLWYPVEQVYGLALEDGDSYEASPKTLDFSTISSGDTAGLLHFFIRFFPLNGGTILSAIFDYGIDPVALRLFLAENALYLEVEGEGKRILSDPLEIEGARASFIDLALNVEIQKTGLTISFEPADSPLVSQVPPEAGKQDAVQIPLPEQEDSRARSIELELRKPLSGELRSWLGKADQPEEKAGESPVPADEKSGSSPVFSPIAVVDDFFALFRVSTETYDGQTAVQAVTGAPQTAQGEAVPVDGAGSN
ncbi:MAG: hypothetical protein LBD96_07700 [Treponema sp.]|jgi:hypothetical protein|nr:hypothetical protein [Treponema sp.]